AEPGGYAYRASAAPDAVPGVADAPDPDPDVALPGPGVALRQPLGAGAAAPLASRLGGGGSRRYLSRHGRGRGDLGADPRSGLGPLRPVSAAARGAGRIRRGHAHPAVAAECVVARGRDRRSGIFLRELLDPRDVDDH